MLHTNRTLRQGAGFGGFPEPLLAPVHLYGAFLELLACSESASVWSWQVAFVCREGRGGGGWRGQEGTWLCWAGPLWGKGLPFTPVSLAPVQSSVNCLQIHLPCLWFVPPCLSVVSHHHPGGFLVGYQERPPSSLPSWRSPDLPHHPCRRGDQEE